MLRNAVSNVRQVGAQYLAAACVMLGRWVHNVRHGGA